MHDPALDDAGPDATAAANTPHRGWFQRHWVWIVPTAVVALLLSCCGGAVFVTMNAAFGIVRESAVYQQALGEIRDSREVRGALGTPIEDGWLTSGSISINGANGSADLRIPLEGPDGDGAATVRGTLANGVWTIDTLLVDTPDGTFDLRADTP